MEYKIIKENTISKMEAKVQSHLNEGWIPQGGLCTDAIGTGSGPYLQALILKS